MEESFTKGMCNWFLCLMFISCIEKLAWNLFGLLKTDIINEKIYELGTVNISSFPKPVSTWAPWTYSQHNSDYLFLNQENLMHSSWSAPKYCTIFYQCVKISKIYNPQCIYVYYVT